MTKYTFKEFQTEYPDDGACLDRIMQVQYGGTQFSCPACGADSKFSRIAKRRAYACQWCGHHVYPCVDTIFEKSSTKLTVWFFVMYMMTSTRHGVAAKEIQRQTGVTYKCAWRICDQLWKLMAVADDQSPLSGHIEVDETYVGGRKRRVPGDKKVERDGIIRAGTVPDVKQTTLEPIVLTNVQRGSIVSTDELRTYSDLANAPYQHGTVNHCADEFARDIHHVNTLEGHWARLKLSMRGTHVHVSSKHLWRYVSEFSYRRNFRHSHNDVFNRLVASFSLPVPQET